MKTLIHSFGSFRWQHGFRLAIFGIVGLCAMAVASARTITLTLEFAQLKYAVLNPYYSGQTFYTVNVLVSSDVDLGTNVDQINSPGSNPAFGGSEGGNGYSLFGDFASAVNAATNGNWTLTTTNGATYTFTVSVNPNAGAIVFPAVQINTPADGNQSVSTNTPFNWSGPASWTELDLADHDLDYSFYDGDSPDPTATSWDSPPTLPLGTNFFEVTYQTNAAAFFTISVPVDNLSHPFTNWVSATKLSDFAQSEFVTVTNPVALEIGHTLIAHYTFDGDENHLGVDASPNDNNIGAYDYSYWGQIQTNSADAETGAGAIQFFGTSCLTPENQVLTNFDNILAGSFTFSGWVKTTTSQGNDNDDAVNGATVFWAYNDHNNTNDTIPLAITGSKAAFSTRDHLGNSSTIHSVTSINDGNYHLITVTRNQSTGEKRLYVDGNFEASEFGTTDPLNGNNYFLSIGGTTISSYAGLLDDLQIYSGVLSPGEITNLYSNPGSTAANVSGLDFNSALNTTNLPWATSGDTDWFIETTNTYDGVSAAQSGSVINNQSSTLSVTVTGPGTLTFWWNCLADETSFDYIAYLDGDPNGGYLDDLYTDSGWIQDGPFNIPAGTHTVSWTAFAYGDTDPNEAGFLDQVSYVPDTAPMITLNPFSQTNYPGYSVYLSAGATNNAALAWQWYKVGSGAIAGATNYYLIPTNSGVSTVAGSYYAIATTPLGSANTTTAAVSFVTAPLPPDWSLAFKSPFFPVDEDSVTKDYYYGCTVDTNGNIYVAAEFGGNTDVGASNLDSGTGGDAAAIVKQSPTGSPVWAFGITNNGAGSSYAECVAPAPGNGVYLAGNYSGTNWLGTTKLIDAGNGDMFIARFDVNGSNIWLKTFGGTNTDFLILNSLASDSSGNVTLAGLLGSGPVTIGSSNYNVVGQQGILVQLDSTGVVRWSQLLPAWPQYLTYSAGRLYASLNSTTIGGTTNVVIGGISNITDRAWAIASLNDTNGQAFWIRGVGAQNGSANGNPYSVGLIDDVPRLAVSGTNVFITGVAYSSTALFGAINVSFNSLRGQYFARYDTNGNAQVATTYGSVTTTPIAAVADTNGNVYVSGNYDDYSFFGIDEIAAPQNTIPYTGDYAQAFVAKFDRNGNPLWARGAVSTTTVNLLGIALASGGVWASGWCQSGYYPQTVPTAFGTNNVYSDAQYVGGGAGGSINIIWYPAGVLAKITDATSATPVTLLNPHDIGANFQFQFLSENGFNHNILYRTNLVAGNWQTNSTVAGDGTVKIISLPFSIFGSSKQGFIRVSTQ